MSGHYLVELARRREGLVHLLPHGRVILIPLVVKNVSQPLGGIVQLVCPMPGIRFQTCNRLSCSGKWRDQMSS
jgi:hypothetical protein